MAFENDIFVYAVIAAFVVASIGLWWFQLVLQSVKKLERNKRYGVYAAVWLAYFVLTLVFVGQAQQ